MRSKGRAALARKDEVCDYLMWESPGTYVKGVESSVVSLVSPLFVLYRKTLVLYRKNPAHWLPLHHVVVVEFSPAF